jgi:hypothetical protein
MMPEVDTFSFPYLQLLNKRKLTEEFRLRFSKNLPRIVAVNDAWTLGTTKSFDRSKKLRCINPKRLSGYLSDGIWLTYANTCSGPHSRAFYLPNPIFRYWALFPKNFLEKFQNHAELFHLPNFGKLPDIAAHINDPDTFWRLGSDALFETRFKERPNYPETYNSVERKNHPAVIQEFIANPNVDHYYIREEMFELIKSYK